MSMFPGAHARVYYNEAGEPLGWEDTTYDDDPTAYYCDVCGYDHTGPCSYDDEDG